MGGAVSGGVNQFNKALTDVPVIGHALRSASMVFAPTALLNGAADIDRSVQDPGGAKNTASNALTAQNQALSQQRGDAAALNNTLLTQPKNITPDNFLANKASQLANLKLGLAGTMTGAGGAPGAVLGSTSLTGNYPGKQKLGQ